MRGAPTALARCRGQSRAATRPDHRGRSRLPTGIALATLALTLPGYLCVVRPRHMRWGATDAEIARSMPLDEAVPHPIYVTNRAVTLRATPETIWPWLVQMGEMPRGGFYSIEWIERLLGLQVRNTDRILPAFQQVQVGEALDRAGTMRVRAVDPQHHLVLGPMEHLDAFNSTWALALYPAADGSTRLVSRVRAAVRLTPGNLLLLAILDPGQFIMEWEMFRQLRERVERPRPTVISAPVAC